MKKTAKDEDLIPLFVDEEPAGHLRRTPKGCRLELAEDLAPRLGRDWLSYRLPTHPSAQTFEGVGLPPYFAGLLPEGLRLRALVRSLKTSADDLFTLLAAAGHDPVGDIHFRSNDVDTGPSPAEVVFADLRERLRRDARDPAGQTLAGVQDKLSTDRLNLRLSGARGAHMLKLGSPDHPDLIENESACLRLAKKCGIEVNSHKIVRDKSGESALLVRRFDREWDPKAKRLRRFHQEDACQLLDRYPADKYRLSMQEIAKALGEICSAPDLEILSLLRLTAFSYLVGNGDLHAKNISLLQISPTTPARLSPAYDLVCTYLYGDDSMALKLDGKDRNLRQKTFVEFGRRFGLSKAAVPAMLKRLTANFAKNRSILLEIPLAQKKQRALNKMIDTRLRDLSGD